MTCKHCGKTIIRWYGPYYGWVHENGLAYCRMSIAEPEVPDAVEE